MTQSSHSLHSHPHERTWLQQFKSVFPWLLLTATIMLVSVIVVFVVHYSTSVNVLVLLVDPVAEVGLPGYVGVFSHIGVLLLWSGATASLLAWAVLRGERSGREKSRYLLWFGLVLAWMAIDDLFLIHEEIGLVLAESVGRPEDRSLFEAPVFVLYGVLVLALLGRFRLTIMRTPWLLLALGLVGLVVSAGIDIGEFVVPDLADSTPWMGTTLSVIEDLVKLGGITLLASYAISTGLMIFRDGRDVGGA